MGLFGKMFEKKNCDICGGEIGLLGNKASRRQPLQGMRVEAFAVVL